MFHRYEISLDFLIIDTKYYTEDQANYANFVGFEKCEKGMS